VKRRSLKRADLTHLEDEARLTWEGAESGGLCDDQTGAALMGKMGVESGAEAASAREEEAPAKGRKKEKEFGQFLCFDDDGE
jgi:hypothetical protein